MRTSLMESAPTLGLKPILTFHVGQPILTFPKGNPS